MKHDTRTGWCICGERHGGKLPREAAPPKIKAEKPVPKPVARGRKARKMAVIAIVKKADPSVPAQEDEREPLLAHPFHVAYPRLF